MRLRPLIHTFLAIFLLAGSISLNNGLAHASDSQPEAAPDQPAAAAFDAVEVSLRTPTQTTIHFAAAGPAPISSGEGEVIPHLVLNRNGFPTPGFERTLEISVANLPVQPPGVYVELTVTTQHGDPDLGGAEDARIEIWQETTFVRRATESSDTSLDFTITFDALMQHGDRVIATPTDYFQLQISILDMQGDLQYSRTEEFAFLMENQWRVPLPDVLESSPGSAPDTLLVYYYDMLPFQANPRSAASRMPRQEVEKYIQTELIPGMVEAFRVQTDSWNFPWHPEWRNFRQDEDSKTLSVALTGADTWFHGAPPALGHSMISIRVDGSFAEYDSLTDGILSVFHHELFHNHQRNISLHFKNHAFIAGKDEAWLMFSEGTAVLASSVGQPEVQFAGDAHGRSYIKRASAFIGSEGVTGGGLNRNYSRIPYQTSTYWRFLYEKCGGMKDGREDPAAGMQVIRAVLETLYRGEIVDITTSTDMVESLPKIMDHVLANSPACPFRGYADSLTSFGRAIYLLKLNDGRCIVPGGPGECGFYDPHRLYPVPPVETRVELTAATTEFTGTIPASYGMDFIEVFPSPAATGKSLTIHVSNTNQSVSKFALGVLEIKDWGLGFDPFKGFALMQEVTDLRVSEGELRLDIRDLNERSYLVLIITRMDSYELDDPLGAYTIQFTPE